MRRPSDSAARVQQPASQCKRSKQSKHALSFHSLKAGEISCGCDASRLSSLAVAAVERQHEDGCRAHVAFAALLALLAGLVSLCSRSAAGMGQMICLAVACGLLLEWLRRWLVGWLASRKAREQKRKKGRHGRSKATERSEQEGKNERLECKRFGQSFKKI